MKYLIQRELLGLLKDIGLGISEQKFIDNKKRGNIPDADIKQRPPYPSKYKMKTVRGVCLYFAKKRSNRSGRGVIIISASEIDQKINKIIEERKFTY